MDSIDKLLASIKAEYNKSDTEQPKQSLPKKASEGFFQDEVYPSTPQNFKSEASLDSLLSEVEAETSTNQQPSTKLNQPLKNTDTLNNILSDIKKDYEAQERASEEIRQSQLKAEQERQQQLKQQAAQKLQLQAIAWLKELDSLSSEGLWFDSFAKKYDSKLAAAIAYLQTN